jgi:hypothetical protein
MATQAKFFFGGHDLEDRINAWLKEQPTDFTLLQASMTPCPAEPPGDGTTLAISVWYRLDTGGTSRRADRSERA